MTNNPLTLFCLVDGEPQSNVFSVKAAPADTIDDLKKLIKAQKANQFSDVDADQLTLWRVAIPIIRDKSEIPCVFNNIPKEEKEKLHPADDLSDVFDEKPAKKTIHIIVQRPPLVHAPVPSRAVTPLPGSLSDDSRPSSPLSGDLHADIKRIADKFFAPGPIANFLGTFVKGQGALPTTSGSIRGLPRAWRRGFGKPPENRPSLLFMDLPNPSTPGSASRNHAAGSILELVQENNRPVIPVFGVSGCGKTRAAIELLSQHWGFYFNASNDDWGSEDMMTLRSAVQKDLNDTRGSFISSGSGLKDSSATFEDEHSKQALNEYLSQEAVEMLFQKFEGRYRPAIAAIERIVECNDPGAWKKTIEDAEDRLVSWAHRHIKGNLCYEISRLHDKHNKYKTQIVESIDSMLGLLMYQRCMFGNHDLVLKEVDPQLVEHAFGRIKIIKGRAVTVMDEPFVSKAVENYFAAIDPYFARKVRKRMVKSTAIEQGCMFERFMMKVFSETFNTRPLAEWPHQPPISDMCPTLVGKVEIVGWREPGLEQGATHAMMSMKEFMDAHVNHGSIRNNLPVAPFFFPKSKPSGPDLVFFIRIDGARLVPVFVQMKLHQGSSNFSEKDWNDALSTVSAPKIEGHAKAFRKYCPDNVYVSMIVAYPTKWSDKLPESSELPEDPSGVQQVVINIGDNNFGSIFPKEHVEFIDRLKNARKRSADDRDSDDGDCPKKPRS
ncbi:hypothetical protein EC957_009801 [Mortierella hygrophila]|uniref:Crinkler effector protein N-terminal domain-containing protein n=1 Tax=Mortierella hygrophila TaxID=979708 RepID=A0A9P6JXP6_9FUNG|nr:hypothetical protein EC957_009801 [Mortierella hygrophila]